VSARDLSVGDMAAVGQRAFQITDLARPKVLFYRPQRELSLLCDGQPLTAISEALPGVVVRGRIERVSPVVDAATGTVKVTAALEPEGRVLPVGLLMRVEVVLERREGVLLVPKEALLYETENLAVFVARDGIARRLVLVPGLEDARHVEALNGSGLAEGDALIVVGADRLADGDPVEVAAE
jgi:membrane fusion protein (multidrug efflux system)